MDQSKLRSHINICLDQQEKKQECNNPPPPTLPEVTKSMIKTFFNVFTLKGDQKCFSMFLH
jgi:hypothetical protein